MRLGIEAASGTAQMNLTCLVRHRVFMGPWRTTMQSWQMQTAKARFSEVVKHAADEGPQEITVHGWCAGCRRALALPCF